MRPPLGVLADLRAERPFGHSEGERTTEKGHAMIILGLVLLVAGFLTKLSVLWTIGIILLIVGVVLALLGTTGRAVGGRRHYF